MAEENEESQKKKIDRGSVHLQLAGDLLMARCPDRALAGLFRRYEALLETLANMPREERVMNYKFFLGLIFTSHAKKTKEIDERKALFDLKNELFINVANNRDTRRKVAFKYLLSKNFRVLEYCKKCLKSNEEKKLPRHQWKFCDDCTVDRKFYNVLSMHHKFNNGSMTMFLSNDQIEKLYKIRLTNKDKLENFKEEASFDKYHYNVKNLDVFSLDDVKKVYEKLIKI